MNTQQPQPTVLSEDRQYEKVDATTLKEITTRAEAKQFDIGELKAQKETLESEYIRISNAKAQQDAQFDESLQANRDELTKVEALIVKAGELGVIEPAPEPAPDPSPIGIAPVEEPLIP
jgi:hypothetical protein